MFVILRKRLVDIVVLVGGFIFFLGFFERLEMELAVYCRRYGYGVL